MKHRLQQVLLLVFYTISMVALSIPLVQLVTMLSPDNLFPLLASLLLYLVLAVALGCLIHTITYIPSNLATEFDPIKNDISTGNIKDTEELGRRLSLFVTRFFDFAFLDINFAFLHTEQSGLVSCEDLPELSSAMDQFEMLEKSKIFKEIMRAGKVTLAEEDYHLYVLPIWIGDQWLGYMGLLSKRRIGRFFQKLLEEFENNFLDDQLMLVIRTSQNPGS
ncbi:MAG: hypothetical protein QNK35_03900 [Bacteroides sp.]|nr:hypothetical protein [Bacteroides sp.]